MDYGQLL
jgi:hypothetical protein